MKPQHFAVLAGSLLVTVLILLLAGRTPGLQGQAAVTPPRTVTVMGESEVQARPDQVTLTFGISAWTQGASAAEAEALNLASMLKLREAIGRAGVTDEHMQSEHPVVAPLTRQDYAGKTYLTGYESVSRVVVTVTNLTRTDAIIAAGLANGATALESAVYGVASPEAVKRQAVQNAIGNARERAIAIASTHDRTLGDLLAVEVLDDDTPTPEATTPGGLRYRVRVRAMYGF